ncbi:MAG: SxtJ family membrane protein [Gemmatimonadaceae bacterium]
MGTGIPAGLKKAPMTAAEGRKFGLTVGLAFIAIGAVLMWRQHPTKSMVAFSLGGVLVLSGLVIPTLLRPVESAWMGLALLISKVTTPIFMGIVYFVVITPIGFIRKRAGNGSPIHRKRGVSSWNAHSPAVSEGEQMERQF